MSDIFYFCIAFGGGVITGGVVFGGIISQQLGNRLIAANDRLAEARKNLAKALEDADTYYESYSAATIRSKQTQDALEAAEAKLVRNQPRGADGRFVKAA